MYDWECPYCGLSYRHDPNTCVEDQRRREIEEQRKWPPGWTPKAIKELIEAGKVILPNIDQPVPYEDYRRFQKALAALEKP